MGDGRHHADHDDLGAYVFELAQIAALPERSMLEGDALIPIAEPDAGRTVAVPWPPPWQLDVTRLGERAARGATHELHEAAAALASGAEVVTVHATIVPADHYTTTPMVLIVGPHRLAGQCHRLVRDVAPYLEPCELDLVSIPSGAGRARLRWEAPGLDEAAVIPGHGQLRHEGCNGATCISKHWPSIQRELRWPSWSGSRGGVSADDPA